MRFRLLACSVLLAACSGSSTDEAPTSGGGSASAACGAGDHELAPGAVDPNDTKLAVANGFVWYGHAGGAGGTVSRIPLAGGDVETLVPSSAAAFAVSRAGALAWASVQPSTKGGPATSLQIRDANGAITPLPLPDGVSIVTSLAFDRAENLFVLSDIVIRGFGTGVAVWRWSNVRKTFDLMHKLTGGLGPFYPDGDGMAWGEPPDASSTDGGGPRIFHEDATGGSPTAGPQVPERATIIGVDAQKIYWVDSDFVSLLSIDRGTLANKIEVTFHEPRPASVADVSVDDDAFYWRAIDSVTGTATISRQAKGGGTPTVFASAVELGPPSVGSCTVAFLQKADESGSWAIMTKSP